MKRIKFRLTAYTDPAGRRTDVPPLYGNEDNFFVDADLSNEQTGEFLNDKETELSDYGSLLAIADGMGGMNAGEVASAIAIDTVKKCFSFGQLTKDNTSTAKARERYMEQVVGEADSAIKAHAKLNPECEGMGSTLIMVWICDGMASVTWCGDSRAYLFREPIGLKQISKDHSYVQSLVDEGKITEDEAFDHPYGNIVTRSLGDPERRAQADSFTCPIYKGDIILLCSDGLSGVLRDRKTNDHEGKPRLGGNLEDIIRDNQDSMQKCREALWTAAERSNWYDNVTAILYQITSGKAAPLNKPFKTPIDEHGKGYYYFRLSKRSVLWTIITIVIIAILICGFFCFRSPHHVNGPIESPDTTGLSTAETNCGELESVTDTNAVEDSAIAIIEKGHRKAVDAETKQILSSDFGQETETSDNAKTDDSEELTEFPEDKNVITPAPTEPTEKSDTLTNVEY